MGWAIFLSKIFFHPQVVQDFFLATSFILYPNVSPCTFFSSHFSVPELFLFLEIAQPVRTPLKKKNSWSVPYVELDRDSWRIFRYNMENHQKPDINK